MKNVCPVKTDDENVYQGIEGPKKDKIKEEQEMITKSILNRFWNVWENKA